MVSSKLIAILKFNSSVCDDASLCLHSSTELARIDDEKLKSPREKLTCILNCITMLSSILIVLQGTGSSFLVGNGRQYHKRLGNNNIAYVPILPLTNYPTVKIF